MNQMLRRVGPFACVRLALLYTLALWALAAYVFWLAWLALA